MDLIYFSSIDWNATWQRPQQLASRLTRWGRVIYINPLGLRAATLRDLPRIIRRFRSRPSIVETHVSATTPTICNPRLYLPLPNNSFARALNAKLLERGISQITRQLDIQKPVWWIGIPSPVILNLQEHLPVQALVYDCIDHYAAFHRDQSFIEQTEFTIASRAWRVFATSTRLYERMRQINPQTWLVPNAVDWEHFAKPLPDNTTPLDIADIPSPILGYYGELARWFDFDLIVDLATRHPTWSIVLIGQAHTAQANRFDALPNVYRLGRKSYAELPMYVHRFNVCLLPFQVNDFTESINPVKLYEYLASGKPVVSTPIRETLPFGDVIALAPRETFAGAIQNILMNDDTQREQRLALARHNTWDDRIALIAHHLE